jgi:hypothetical protein
MEAETTAVHWLVPPHTPQLSTTAGGMQHTPEGGSGTGQHTPPMSTWEGTQGSAWVQGETIPAVLQGRGEGVAGIENGRGTHRHCWAVAHAALVNSAETAAAIAASNGTRWTAQPRHCVHNARAACARQIHDSIHTRGRGLQNCNVAHGPRPSRCALTGATRAGKLGVAAVRLGDAQGAWSHTTRGGCGCWRVFQSVQQVGSTNLAWPHA